jgi:hypothetical protein
MGYPDDTTTCKEDDKVRTTGRSAVIVAVALLGLLFLPFHVSAEPAPPQASKEAKAEAGKKMDGMEGMKKHLEEARKGIAGLRDHEKKMEGVTDPVEFRKAAIEHFRMLDDLQESHVKHMESMAGGKGPGHSCKEPCKEPCPEHSGK